MTGAKALLWSTLQNINLLLWCSSPHYTVSTNFIVPFISALEYFPSQMASRSTFPPLTVRGQAFSSAPAQRQLGDVRSAASLSTVPRVRVWVLSWCPVLNLAGFLSSIFFYLPLFLLFIVLSQLKTSFASPCSWIISILHVLCWLTYWHFKMQFYESTDMHVSFPPCWPQQWTHFQQ